MWRTRCHANKSRVQHRPGCGHGRVINDGGYGPGINDGGIGRQLGLGDGGDDGAPIGIIVGVVVVVLLLLASVAVFVAYRAGKRSTSAHPNSHGSRPQRSRAPRPNAQAVRDDGDNTLPPTPDAEVLYHEIDESRNRPRPGSNARGGRGKQNAAVQSPQALYTEPCPQQTVEYDTAREAGTAGESVEYDVVQRALNSDVMPYAPIQQGSQAPYASIADTDLQETAI